MLPKRTSLAFKILITFLIVAGLVIIANVYNNLALERIVKRNQELVSINYPALQTLSDIKLQSLEIEDQLLTYRDLSPSAKSNQEALKKDIRRKFLAMKAQLEILPVSSQVKTDKLTQSIDTVASDVSMLLSQANVQASASSYLALEQSFTKNQKLLKDEMTSVINSEEESTRKENNQLSEDVIRLSMITAGFSGATIAYSVIIGLILAYSVTKSLKKLRSAVDEVGKGNFAVSIDVNSNDELGQLGRALHDMASHLQVSYQQLSKEYSKNATLLQSISEAIIAVDTTSKIQFANPYAMQLLDLKVKGIIGKTLYELAPLYLDQYNLIRLEDHPVYQSLQKHSQIKKILYFKTSDDKFIALDFMASPIISNNNVAGVLMVIRDITKEREVDRMKTEFISIASHQLRTPLSAIKWYSEMLLSGDAGELSKDQRDFTSNISISTERMIQLVNSLLNISRIESGRIIVDPKPTDLKFLVQGVVTELKVKIDAKKQNLMMSVHDALPMINLDPQLVRQVFMNLLTNAIKYTKEEGEIMIIISRKDQDIICQVSDNGYGIPKSQQNKVFQKFFRAENVAKIETDGTGLGLYLVKAVIESSKGKIWFASEEGKGTTFWFSLPVTGMQAKSGEVSLDG